MRDLDKDPYTPDEERVAAYFCTMGIGGGDDPVGNLIAAHMYKRFELKPPNRIGFWQIFVVMLIGLGAGAIGQATAPYVHSFFDYLGGLLVK